MKSLAPQKLFFTDRCAILLYRKAIIDSLLTSHMMWRPEEMNPLSFWHMEPSITSKLNYWHKQAKGIGSDSMPTAKIASSGWWYGQAHVVLVRYILIGYDIKLIWSDWGAYGNCSMHTRHKERWRGRLLVLQWVVSQLEVCLSPWEILFQCSVLEKHGFDCRLLLSLLARPTSNSW